MILINQQESKKVYFYLTPTISPTYYLFRFLSNDTGNEILMMSENLSAYSHFQTFTFSEGSTQSQFGGFNLLPGTYDYQVYQTQYATLSIASASGILETGLMTVLAGTGSCYIWKPEADNDFVYYDPCAPAPTGLTGS